LNLNFKICLALCLSVFINSLRCQYFFNSITEDKGLISNQVRCILKDSNGFVWLGTNNGVCRFDGSEITAFRHDPADSNSVCDNDVKSIYQDKNGVLWIGTVKGVSAYNEKNKQFKSFIHDPEDPATLSNNKVQLITGDRLGKIYIATDGNGVDIFDPDDNTFSHYLPSDQINVKPARFVNTFMGYAHDPFNENLIWFGTQLGIVRFDIISRIFTQYFLEYGNAYNPTIVSGRENLVRDILIDESGKLWLATWGGGLCHFNPSDGKYEVYKFEPLHPVNGYRNNISKLHWKSRDEIWILAPHRGVSVFNTTTHEFIFLMDEKQHEMDISPSDIITDDQGFIWISTYTGGLLFTNMEAYQFNKTYIPYPLKGVAVCPSNPDLIITGVPGTYGKIVTFDISSTQYSTYDYLPVNDQSENYFQDMFCGNDRVWLIESYNLYWWDDKLKKVRLYSEFNLLQSKVSEATMIPFLFSGSTSTSGELWIGTTFNGIFRNIPQTGSVINYYYPDSLAGNLYLKDFIFEIFVDHKDRVWYGSTDFGYFDPEKNKFVNLSLGRDFPGSPVKSAIVRTITETPEGNIWLGTVNSGIQIIDPNDTLTFIGSYMENQGLAGSLIVDLLTDHNGDVWAITDKGLSHIIPSTQKVENFGQEYGLINLKNLALHDNGEIIIVADRGIYRFRSENIHQMSLDIKPYFKSIRIFDKVFDVSDMFSGNKKIVLQPNENFFSIEYGAINFFNPEETEFSYMLEGQDKEWILAGNRKYVSYTNLSGGNYNFKLRASVKAETVAEISLPLFVKTPFWKTIIFYVILLILISTIVYILFKRRTYRIKKEEEMKTRYNMMINELEMKALRAQMNPHFLFNSLNSIRYYILQEEFDNASDYITKFAKLLRLILHNSRQNQITLSEELEMISIYIEFEQMRFDNSFEYEEVVDAALNLGEIMIQPMTIQPFLENAIWHGLMPKVNDRRLRLELAKDNRLLRITIQDNGVGREYSSRKKSSSDLAGTKSYGLQIIRERFEVLSTMRGKRSDFEIIDLQDEMKNSVGTQVNIFYEL